MLRDRRQGAQVERAGLLQVELGLVAAPKQALGDLEASLLQRGVLVRDAQAQLAGADARIEARGLRRDEHLEIVVLGDAREVLGVRRPRRRDGTCPRSPAPRRRRARCWRSRDPDRRAVALLRPDPQAVAAELLQLRVEVAAGDPELCARLEDAKARGAHAGIDALGLLHELLEHPVAELAPPLVDLHGLCVQRLPAARLVQRVGGPALEPRHGGTREVGAHGARSRGTAARERRAPAGANASATASGMRFSRPTEFRLPARLPAHPDSVPTQPMKIW